MGHRTKATCIGAFALLLGAIALPAAAQTAVTLVAPAVPDSGVPGTGIAVLGSGFPWGGIEPRSVQVRLAPVVPGTGPEAATPATTLQRVGERRTGNMRQVFFLLPPSLLVATPTSYEISLSGVTTSGEAFASINTLPFTVDPVPALASLMPSSGVVGTHVTVTLTARRRSMKCGSRTIL